MNVPTEMTAEHRKIARHMLGLDNPNFERTSYRNRYYAGRGDESWWPLHEMGAAGWINMEDQANGKQDILLANACRRRVGARAWREA